MIDKGTLGTAAGASAGLVTGLLTGLGPLGTGLTTLIGAVGGHEIAEHHYKPLNLSNPIYMNK